MRIQTHPARIAHPTYWDGRPVQDVEFKDWWMPIDGDKEAQRMALLGLNVAFKTLLAAPNHVVQVLEDGAELPTGEDLRDTGGILKVILHGSGSTGSIVNEKATPKAERQPVDEETFDTLAGQMLFETLYRGPQVVSRQTVNGLGTWALARTYYMVPSPGGELLAATYSSQVGENFDPQSVAVLPLFTVGDMNSIPLDQQLGVRPIVDRVVSTLAADGPDGRRSFLRSVVHAAILRAKPEGDNTTVPMDTGLIPSAA